LRPACPLTAKWPAILQVGASCLTTKTTRAARGSTKVRVVTRRRFGPLVAIQLREERKRCTLGRSALEPGPAEAEEEEDEPAEPVFPPLGPATEDTEGSAGVTGAAERAVVGLGTGTAGAGSLGVVGSGTATGVDGTATGVDGTATGVDGTATGVDGTVTAGRGGTGTVSAKASPPKRAAPTSTVVAAAALTPSTTRSGPKWLRCLRGQQQSPR
jgi:hypothetical protein